jgi:hypothetical protein
LEHEERLKHDPKIDCDARTEHAREFKHDPALRARIQIQRCI